MVFYFTLHSDPRVKCYMGRDKYENEELIRWGWPEDFWFHVDDHSSAHVYIRLPPGKTVDDLTEEMVEECAQLTKANSIEGCKLNNVKVVYTPWSNLKKTGAMEVGQVGFHDESLRRYFTVAKKNSTILNRLEKTRVVRDEVDFRAEREERDSQEAREMKKKKQEAEQKEREEKAEHQRIAEMKSYKTLMDDTQMHTNAQGCDEDDFM